MASVDGTIVILGTGGTIAGTAASAADNLGYTSAQLGVQQLVAAVPPLAAWPIEAEQVAQVDSKDMTHAIWRELAARVDAHLKRPEVAGVVITHGTDTLEETAYFLHRVVASAKPVVLTAAMRPATSLQADGPQNLLDAVTVAREPGARGVLVALAGRVLAGHEARKVHSFRVDAFASGDAGPLALLQEGQVRQFRPWPEAAGAGIGALPDDDGAWPWVEVVTSHAGARGAGIDALVGAGVQGFVVAGTGNGTVHSELEAALQRAARAGVAVWRASRCASGGVVGAGPSKWPAFGGLTPAQARIEVMLRLLIAMV